MTLELLIAQAQEARPEKLTTGEAIAGGLCCMAPFIIFGLVLLAILAFAFGWFAFLIKWMNDMRKK